jgi:hypothetical protein
MLGPGSAIAAPGLTVSDEAIQAVVGNAAAHDAPVAQPAYAFASGGTYSALVYERTAAVLETVRRVYGADRMERALRTYAATFRFEHPGPEDLLRTIGDVVGGEAAAAVRRALFEKGWVDYAVVEVVSNPTTPARGIFDRPGGERETVRDPAGASSEFDGWALVERRGPLSFPVDIELRLADGTRTRVAWDGHDASVRIPYHGKSRLEAAVVDPDDRVLLDDDRTNNHASAAPASTPGARLSLERLSYWAELLVDCVGP